MQRWPLPHLLLHSHRCLELNRCRSDTKQTFWPKSLSICQLLQNVILDGLLSKRPRRLCKSDQIDVSHLVSSLLELASARSSPRCLDRRGGARSVHSASPRSPPPSSPLLHPLQTAFLLSHLAHRKSPWSPLLASSLLSTQKKGWRCSRRAS